MRKKVVFLSLFAGGLALGPALMDLRHREVGAIQPPPVANGDTNGDGEINLTDAVHLLGWLFRGGSEPVAIAPPGPPATGSTGCFDGDGQSIPCASTEYPGQDADHRAGCGSAGASERFVVHGDGTVTDSCTGLMWQADSTSGKSSVWQEALIHATSIALANDGTWVTSPTEADAHGGVKYADWRLPNIRELESIVDYGRVDTATAPEFDVLTAGYWTSSTHAGRPDEAWCVHFFNGETRPILKSAHLQIVLVRGGG